MQMGKTEMSNIYAYPLNLTNFIIGTEASTSIIMIGLTPDSNVGFGVGKIKIILIIMQTN